MHINHNISSILNAYFTHFRGYALDKPKHKSFTKDLIDLLQFFTNSLKIYYNELRATNVKNEEGVGSYEFDKDVVVVVVVVVVFVVVVVVVVVS